MVVQVRTPTLTSGIISTAKRGTYLASTTTEKVAALLPWPKELADGNCKGHPNADAFSNPFTDEELVEATSVCHDCPIKYECYEIGAARMEDGVYGGVYLYGGKPGVLPKYRKRRRK